MTTIITTNSHDSGLDLVEGPLVTGPVVGRIYWDGTGGDWSGFVLRIAGSESFPDGIADVEDELAALGFELESGSRDEIAGLVP